MAAVSVKCELKDVAPWTSRTCAGNRGAGASESQPYALQSSEPAKTMRPDAEKSSDVFAPTIASLDIALTQE